VYASFSLYSSLFTLLDRRISEKFRAHTEVRGRTKTSNRIIEKIFLVKVRKH
jgi:hypothetical protein